MIWQITPYFFLLLASAAISLAIALYAWHHRRNSGAVSLTFLMLAIAIWSIPYAIEIISSEFRVKLFLIGIEYIGIAFLPVAWLALAIEFSGNDSWLSSKRFILLLIIPIITIILVWTNGYHGLIYKEARVDFSHGYPALEIVQGQWYWFNVAYSYALVLIATLLVIVAFIHSSKLYRKQALILLIGALIPWIANLAYMTGWHPVPCFDTTPLAFLTSGIAAAIGLFHFGLLDIMPVARNIVMENISEGIVVLDSNNRILDMNSAALKMTSLNLNQSIGQSATNLLSSLIIPIQYLLELSGNPVEAHMEKEIHAEGENRYYNLSVSPIYGLRGDLKARILLIQDITSRKIAEIRLKESEETALTLLNAPLDAAYLIDDKGIILALSEAGAHNLGKSIEDLKGTYVFDLFSPDIRMKRIKSIEEVFKSGKQVKFEDKRDVRYFNNLILPVFNQENKVTKVAIFVNDITEHERAEEALRESKDYLDKIINSIGDPLFVKDRQHRMILVNDAACKLWEQTCEDLVGKTDYDLFSSKEMADNSWKNEEDVFNKGIEITSEETNAYADKTLTFLVKKTPYTDNAGNQFLVGIIRDITERKQAEDRILVSLKEKEVLLKEVHHRVKNNLQIISALLYLQSSYLTDENIIKVFTDSQNRIKSMALVHENLYRSKDLDRVDFSEYITQLVSHLSQSYGDLASKINFNVKSENVYLNINTAIPCGMIINELVSNSLKHAFPNGRDGEVRIDLSSEDDGFKLVVSDNGVGIKENKNIDESKTLGFRLIEILVKQIDGTLHFDTKNGFRCEIHFKGLK